MNEISERPLVLIILDGWGASASREGNAVALANTPGYDDICRRYPSSRLSAPGPNNGYAAGESGNAELGHRILGAGRPIETDPVRITRAVRSGEIHENTVLKTAFEKAGIEGRRVHFVGLLGDGGIHSSQETLFALLRMARKADVGQAFVHGILDGRDVPPRTADVYVDALEIKMADIGLGRIASLCGRFYAMDSSENWERTARAYTMLVHGEGERGFDAVTAIRASFLRGISDEFISPIVIESAPDEPVAVIADGDLVVFFNHKGSAMRQLVRSLAVPDAASPKPRVESVCLTEYDPSFGLPAAFGKTHGSNLLSDVFEKAGLRNYRITETARSLHVSTYFNGNNSSGGDLERHAFLPTAGPDVLAAEPESKSFKIADAVIRGLDAGGKGVFVVNFPAAALAAETSDLNKAVESIQFVDTCLSGVVDKVIQMNGIAVVTASHAGCDKMGEPAGPGEDVSPTVPLHIIDAADPAAALAPEGRLEDVAPTILGLLGIEKPEEMSGRDLLTRVSSS